MTTRGAKFVMTTDLTKKTINIAGSNYSAICYGIALSPGWEGHLEP